MVFLVMLSCLIFKCNADGRIPSFAAAPFGPVTLPSLDEVVHRCGDLLNPTHLFSGRKRTVDTAPLPRCPDRLSDIATFQQLRFRI